MANLLRGRGAFVREESGSMTVGATAMLLAVLAFSSVGIDFMRWQESRTRLQIAADTVAHGALVARQSREADAAKSVALDLAAPNAGTIGAGRAILAEDIEFGTWDAETRLFSPDPTARHAVRVQATYAQSRDNIVPGLLTRLVGFAGFEVEVSSVFQTRSHQCARAGMLAETNIRFSANNAFGPYYCVHSDHTMTFVNHTDFDVHSEVTLPELGDLTAGKTTGLDAALRARPAWLDVDRLIDDFEASLDGRGALELTIPASLLGVQPHILGVSLPTKVTPLTLLPGVFYDLSCSKGGKKLQFGAGTYRNLAIRTDCEIQMPSSVAFENVIIYQENTSDKAFSAAKGVRFGAQDSCDPAGNAMLVTRGGISVASGLELHGSALVAAGPIKFAANAGTMDGAVVISGDEIRGTANSTFGTCDHDLGLGLYAYQMVD